VFKAKLTFLLPIKNKNAESVWEKKDIIELYNSEKLHEPELKILDLLKPKLSEMKMLDIGVGAGRTTIHFAPLVEEYIGIDCSTNMIKACKNKFRNDKLIFKVLSATDLQSFASNYFDFVMFSFNGLDCILNQEEREKTLNEIRRILKPNGYFYFTSHNLNYLWRFCNFTKPINRHEIRRMILMRIYNWKTWKKIRNRSKNLNYLIANNGSHDFGIYLYFVSPISQLKILQSKGFKVKIIDLKGNSIDLASLEKEENNSYLHYLCQAT
jgi:ubiquinone/menaquinone biosynthesis C-methylase UbiE